MSVNKRKRRRGPYVRRDVSKRQVGRVRRLHLAFTHVFQPAPVSALDMSAAPQFLFEFGTFRGTSIVQGG